MKLEIFYGDYLHVRLITVKVSFLLYNIVILEGQVRSFVVAKYVDFKLVQAEKVMICSCGES